MRSQKKGVAEEEATSKKMGPGIRMLPTTEEDAASAAHVKFSSKEVNAVKDFETVAYRIGSINWPSTTPLEMF
uniref:Uncharacterized protein n=1 Tax=Salix viminalis TaxID=40686 RepID=A0A6N2N3F1_SALVM